MMVGDVGNADESFLIIYLFIFSYSDILNPMPKRLTP